MKGQSNVMQSIRSTAVPAMTAIRYKKSRVVTRVATLFAFLLGVALQLPGCALFGLGDENPEDGISSAPLISMAEELDERSAAAESALAAATQAWRDGDALGAMSIANAALREGAPDEYETKLRALRSRAREALVTSKIARLSVLPARDAVADGTEVLGTVHVRNLSSAPLTIPATADDSSTSQVVLAVLREDFDLYGNMRRTEFNVRIPLEEDLVLAAGGVADIPIAIPSEHVRLSHTGFAVLKIGGHLRPVVIRIGATEFFDALDLDDATVRIFMDGFEQLAADPFASLQRAVSKRSPPHILTAAELLAPDERSRAAAFLLESADADPDLAFVCLAAAARLKQMLADEPR